MPGKGKSHLIYLFLLTCGILATILHAQPRNEWINYYDNNSRPNYINDVFATAEGGYAMAGQSLTGGGVSGYWLIVLDQNGGVLRQRIYTDDRFPHLNNMCYTLIQDDAGGFLLGGRAREREFVGNFSVLRTDPEGDVLWWRIYGAPGIGECYAVIELKNGTFAAVGRDGEYNSMAVMLDGDGNVLWERIYPGRWFRALREVDGGLLISGQNNGRQAWIVRTDFEGEVLWERTYGRSQLMSIISCRDGGFAASGHRVLDQGGGDILLLRIDDEGNELWSSTFNFDRNDWSNCLAQMEDGGFILVGEASGTNDALILRTDVAGNEVMRRTDGRREDRVIFGYRSTVVGHDGMALIAGTGYIARGEQRGPDGILIKLQQMISPPEIIFFRPENLELTVLQGDSIEFTVRAEDMQGDSLSYIWTFDQDTVATDTSNIITFDELDDHLVACYVSDAVHADSLLWMVRVEEFFIRSFEPDNLDLVIRRGTEINFEIDIAAIEEIEVENTWNLTNRDQRQEEIAGADAVSVLFDQSGRHQLQALVTFEDESDEVTWIINVRSAIWSWWPAELEISAYVDSTLEFVITPLNENSDSLEYIWLLDNVRLNNDTSNIDLAFPEVGWYDVTSIVHDGIEADTIRWIVDVEEWLFTTDLTDLSDLPASPVLYPACPNPFNSVVKLSMYLPKSNYVSLSIFEISGREISRLVDGDVGAGSQSLVWDASCFPAGVYVVRMENGDVSKLRKIVLAR